MLCLFLSLPWARVVCLKTSRRGVGEAELMVHGRPAHAGLDPEKGVNAIHELAAQIARIEQWNNLNRGVTINADIVEGGSRVNVIAERAKANLDLRAWRCADMRVLENRLRSLKPIHRGAKLAILAASIARHWNAKIALRLFVRAKSLAKQIGFSLGEAASGRRFRRQFYRGSRRSHTRWSRRSRRWRPLPQEYILVKTMPQRAALLAALLATS